MVQLIIQEIVCGYQKGGKVYEELFQKDSDGITRHGNDSYIFANRKNAGTGGNNDGVCSNYVLHNVYRTYEYV